MALAFARSVSGQSAQPIAIGGGYWLLSGTFTFTGTYPALGEPLDLRNFFPAGKTIREAVVLNDLRGFNAEVDLVNNKIRLWAGGAAAPTVAEHATAAYHATFISIAFTVCILFKG